MAALNKGIKQWLDTVPHLVRWILLGALALFISLLFPDTVQLQYDFDQGKRWQYDDLMAPFDFPIKKSAADLAQEERELKEQFVPYYELDTTVAEAQKEAFIQVFVEKYQAQQQDGTVPDSLRVDSAAYLNLGLSLIEKVYEKGLLRIAPEHQDREEFTFFMLENNVAEERSAEEFFSPKEALQKMVDSLHSNAKVANNNRFLLPLLESAFAQANIKYAEELSQRLQKEQLEAASASRGMVKAGDMIVMRDAIIDSTAYKKLLSFKEKYEAEVNQKKSGFLIYLGHLILVSALIGVFALFLFFYAPEVYNNTRQLVFFLLLIASYAYLATIIADIEVLHLYLVPFCIVPIILKNFYSAQLALLTHIVVILMCGMLLKIDYQFILVQVLVGMVAILTKVKTRYLSDFFLSLLYILGAYAIVFFSLELIEKGSIMPVQLPDGSLTEGLEWEVLGWILLSVFLTLLSYPLIPIFERLFGFTSEITLVELSDLNKPLLKELSLKAPGTLQHSLQVANLAEAAASKVGANALLVKVAALYHDIGKMKQPNYYIENQNHGNPHDDIDDLKSAQIIIEHVTEGVKMAKKHRLPSVLIDFILTHHGTTRVEYFYRNYQKAHPDEEVDEAQFRYPGPKPSTREQAILMLADSLEAACKSLKSPTGQDIDGLVGKIVTSKIKAGQFDASPFSFQDLDEVVRVFKKLLRSIHHVRIEYPEEQKAKEV